MTERANFEVQEQSIVIPPLKVTNYLNTPHNVQVTPNVTGAELNDPSEFSRDTNEISIAHMIMDPETGFEPHVHPFNHVLVILEGAGMLTYDRGDGEDTVLEFEKGDVFNVPGQNPHAVSAGKKGITMFSIGSPSMQLIDPERMVFLAEEHRWMVPQHIQQPAPKHQK